MKKSYLLILFVAIFFVSNVYFVRGWDFIGPKCTKWADVGLPGTMYCEGSEVCAPDVFNCLCKCTGWFMGWCTGYGWDCLINNPCNNCNACPEDPDCSGPGCDPQDSYSCYNNDLWWYDSCGVRENEKEDCQQGCPAGVCLTSTNPDSCCCPYTCAQARSNDPNRACGSQYPNGCGGYISSCYGTWCEPGTTCSVPGGGSPGGTCTCTPRTCAQARAADPNRACGSQYTDGCGSNIPNCYGTNCSSGSCSVPGGGSAGGTCPSCSSCTTVGQTQCLNGPLRQRSCQSSLCWSEWDYCDSATEQCSVVGLGGTCVPKCTDDCTVSSCPSPGDTFNNCYDSDSDGCKENHFSTCPGGGICYNNACCIPESSSVTCAGKCGTVTNNCGQSVNCGGCTATRTQNDGCQSQTQYCSSGTCVWPLTWTNAPIGQSCDSLEYQTGGPSPPYNYCQSRSKTCQLVMFDAQCLGSGSWNSINNGLTCGAIQYQTGGDTNYCQSRTPTCSSGSCSGGSWTSIKNGLICSRTDFCSGDGWFTGKNCDAGTCGTDTGYTACADESCTENATGSGYFLSDSVCTTVPSVGCTAQTNTSCPLGYGCNGTLCVTSCVTNNDCITGYSCVAGVCGKCAFTSVVWNQTTAREGALVSFTVTANQFCNGQSVALNVREKDNLDANPLNNNADDSVTTNPANAVFSGTTANGIWTTQWQADTDCGTLIYCESNPPEFWINASLVGVPRVSTNNRNPNPGLLSVTRCGDGIIDVTSGEACDGSALGTCSNSCDMEIAIDPQNCVCAERCGDGVVQTPNDAGVNEICDGQPGCKADCTGWNPGAYWADLNSQSITEITVRMSSNPKVRMIMTRSGLATGTAVTFNIWEDLLIDQPRRTISGTVSAQDSTTGTVIEWTMSTEDLTAFGEGVSNAHFTVKQGATDIVTSGNLEITVIPEEECYSINICSNYTTDKCESDPCGVANKNVMDLYPSVTCGSNGYTCFCYLDGEDCEPGWTHQGRCGDGDIDSGEQCDGSNWGSITGCHDFDNDFTSGTLTCVNCQFDTTQCKGVPTGVCGDGKINTGEQCDGTDWGSITGCPDFDSYKGGTLTCVNCQFDTSQCVRPSSCGDGIIDSGEQCETNADIIAHGITCSDFDDDFIGGTLSCVGCLINTSACTGGGTGICGDGVVNTGEACESQTDAAEFKCSDFDAFTEGTPSCKLSTCMIDTSLCRRGTSIGTCHIDQTLKKDCGGEPNVGIRTINWTGIWTGPDGALKDRCLAGGEKSIPCPAQVELPFFGIYSLIASSILIAVIYIFIISKRKKRH